MNNSKQRVIIFIVIIFYGLIINPSIKIFKLEKEKKSELIKKINLKDNNIKLLKNKEVFFSKKLLKKKQLKNNKKYFKKIGEYNKYINRFSVINNLKVTYIGRLKIRENKIICSYNIEGNMCNLISFLNEIEMENSIFLSDENFYIECENNNIKAIINLGGYLSKKNKGQDEK